MSSSTALRFVLFAWNVALPGNRGIQRKGKDKPGEHGLDE